MPTHSIIIVTKDRPGLLPRAFESARRALGDLGEIVIVDDASAIPARDVLGDPSGTPVRIHRREVSSGISAARNTGIEVARGAVIFFLDDDDELSPGYVRDILAGPADRFDYGFSAHLTAISGGTPHLDRPRFPTGPIPLDAPLRKQLCGTGMGFWIRREVAFDAGPFSTDIAMNEDTDFVCRLITQGRRAWYSATPGVTVHRHAGPRDLPNITSRLTAVERARAMLVVCHRFPAISSHLGRSFLRHCAKAGLLEEGSSYLQGLPDRRARLSLSVYFGIKRLAYWMRRVAG